MGTTKYDALMTDELGSVDSTNVQENSDMDTTTPSDEDKGSCQVDVQNESVLVEVKDSSNDSDQSQANDFLHAIRHNKPKKAHVTSITAEGTYLFIDKF
jgi:hypothetical protein